MNDQLAKPIDYTVDGECAEGCGKCCSALLILNDSEIAKIKKYLKTHPEVKMNNVNTALKTNFEDVCPFLDENKKCQIYEVRPEICRRFICNKYMNPDYKPMNHKGKRIVNMTTTFMDTICYNAPDLKKLNKMYEEKKKDAGIN